MAPTPAERDAMRARLRFRIAALKESRTDMVFVRASTNAETERLSAEERKNSTAMTNIAAACGYYLLDLRGNREVK